MPLYEYKCRGCGHVFEELLPMSMRNSAQCPGCASTDVVRLFRSVSVHIWTPRVFEHLDDKPILIESKQQLKKECEKRGLIAHCLD